VAIRDRPPGFGPPDAAPSEADKSAALEALAAHRPLTKEQRLTLVAVGLTSGDRPKHIDRPSDEADIVMARRLSRARGWSPAAIGAFVHRSEAQVREMLRPQVRGRRGPS